MSKGKSFADSALKHSYNDLDKAYESLNQSVAKYETSSKGKSTLIQKRINDLHKALDILEKKILKQSLKAPVKKKTLKAKKSVACSKVLKLMDQDCSYQKALKEVLNSDKRLNKKKLETELNNYI